MASGLIISKRLLNLIAMCGNDAFRDDDISVDLRACDSAFLSMAAVLLETNGTNIKDLLGMARYSSDVGAEEIFIKNLVDAGVLSVRDNDYVFIAPEFVIKGE
jgi:hypothetical protein